MIIHQRTTMRSTIAIVPTLLLAAACGREAVAPLVAPSFTRVAVDQSQPIADAAAPFTFAIGGPSTQILAQTFTAGASGKLRQVDLPVACDAGSLVLEVRDLTGGVPGATVLATETYAASTFAPFTPGVATFASLRVTPAPTLTAGTSYALVLSDPTGSCGIIPGPVGDPYAGGTALVLDLATGNWQPLSLGNDRDDLPFVTYVQP
jgi:hypothetical protein